MRTTLRALFGLCFAAFAAEAEDVGFVGIYSDSLGTQPCATIAPYTRATLYVVGKTGAMTEVGVVGAEFRIEVSDPSGWYFAYTPPASAALALGNPLDTSSDENDTSGLNLSFGFCAAPTDSGTIALGTISVFNVSGAGTTLMVLPHNRPSSAGSECPLFVLCDDPVYSTRCMDASAEPPCDPSLVPTFARRPGGGVFTFTLNTEETSPEYEGRNPEHEVIVMFAPGIMELPEDFIGASIENVEVSSERVATSLDEASVETVIRAFPQAGDEESESLVFALVLPENADREAFVEELLSFNTEVIYAHLNGNSGETSAEPEELSAQKTAMTCGPCAGVCPDDAYFEEQWALVNTQQSGGDCDADVDVDEAWQRTTGSEAIKVAILARSSVTNAVPDLENRVFSSELGLPAGEPAVAMGGIIAANSNNGLRLAGLDWKARLISREDQDEVTGDASRVADINAVGSLGANIELIAWQLWTQPNACIPRYSDTVRKALRDAYMANRTVIANMGTGCGGPTNLHYPAAFGRGIIAVGGTNSSDQASPSHVSTGSHIDLRAPSDNVIALHQDGFPINYGWGDDIASAHVAGAASLLLGKYGWLDNDDIERLLQLGADDLGASGFDNTYGFGRLNIRKTFEQLELPNRLYHIDAEGWDGTSQQETIQGMRFARPPTGLAPGTYWVERWIVSKHVNFPTTFASAPKVWGRGWKSTGLSAENPNFAMGWCEPYSVSDHDAYLRTNFFEVYHCGDPDCETRGSYVGQFPPLLGGSPHFACSVLGTLESTDVGEPSAAQASPFAVRVESPISDEHARVTLSLDRTSRARVAVYDVAGRLVKVLRDDVSACGATELAWDVDARLASGIYFVRVDAEGKIATQKVVLLRK